MKNVEPYTPLESFNARQQLGRIEWLSQIIVRAEF